VSEPKKDRFYWSVMKVLKDNGHSRNRARAIYLELHDSIALLLLEHQELHVQGLFTVTVRMRKERIMDGFRHTLAAEGAWVARASVKLRRHLKTLLRTLPRVG
jgi:hypothetical protein